MGPETSDYIWGSGSMKNILGVIRLELPWRRSPSALVIIWVKDTHFDRICQFVT